MNLSTWKIFDKKGSPLNWYADPYLPLTFINNWPTGQASGYLITDVSGKIVNSKITNSGFKYDVGTQVSYNYSFDNETIDITNDVSINYVDVSIFNPTLENSKGILSLDNIDISTNNTYPYPSVVFSSALFLEPVSKGLIETEHLYIFQEINSSLYRPYDTSTSTLVLQMVGDESEIQFFTVDSDTEVITWTDTLIFELTTLEENTPISINIGFRSNDDGVYERRIRIYNLINTKYYLLGEIIVNGESIGEDERFRSLLTNFGLPDPKDTPHLFKEADINEALPDYKLINSKSKHMILEHDNIIPFIGTYKALINALKWLGYDDIYVREWFKNVKENKKLSLIVPYNAKDRSKTILKFSEDERRSLKKLNQLSLNYCLTRETGEIDDWGTPVTENCYSYSIEEVFAKLLALKQWLERNILGVNARIIDITGEGIYFERYVNLIYATDNIGYDYRQSQSLTPYTINGYSELINGEASIYMTLKEYENLKLNDLPYRIKNYEEYVWDPATDRILSADDPSYLADTSSYMMMGPIFSNPFCSLNDIQWKASLENPYSGVITNNLVSSPLWVYQDKLNFYNIFDTSVVFYDSSINLSILLEKAYLRNAANAEWENSIEYSIYPDPDPSVEGGYIMESSMGVQTKFGNYVTLQPYTNSLLRYAYDDVNRNNLLSFKNFKTDDVNDTLFTFTTDKLYHLDIVDGKISMNYDSSEYQDINYYINYSYDFENYIQNIALNVEYISPRMPIYILDPSSYYWADPSGLSGGGLSILSIDNSIYSMKVNHIGEYNVEVFAWDGYNTLFTNPSRKKHKVYIKEPIIYTLYKDKYLTDTINSSTFIDIDDVNEIILSNNKPIFDREIMYKGIELCQDSSGTYVKIPSVTYFESAPSEIINRFFNFSEEITNINGNDISINNLYQNFYENDDIIVMQIYKGNYMPVNEVSSHITTLLSDNSYTLDVALPFNLDTSHNIYVLNDTKRYVTNIINNEPSVLCTIDVSGYTFLTNQLINLIIEDTCTGYSWASSYRVIDSSGSDHTINSVFPSFIIDNSIRYNTYAKHGYSTYASYEIDNSTSYKTYENDIILYDLNDDYRKHMLDSTFTMINVPFHHDYVDYQWYDASLEGILTDASEYYYYDNPLIIDVSSLILLRCKYDSSTYMSRQKNIWTIVKNDTKDIVLRVYNDTVPFVFDVSGYYDIQVETYDHYGNLALKLYEGFLKVE